MLRERLTENCLTGGVTIDIGAIEKRITGFHRALKRRHAALDRGRVYFGAFPSAGDPHAAIGEPGNFDVGSAEKLSFHGGTSAGRIAPRDMIGNFECPLYYRVRGLTIRIFRRR